MKFASPKCLLRENLSVENMSQSLSFMVKQASIVNAWGRDCSCLTIQFLNENIAICDFWEELIFTLWNPETERRAIFTIRVKAWLLTVLATQELTSEMLQLNVPSKKLCVNVEIMLSLITEPPHFSFPLYWIKVIGILMWFPWWYTRTAFRRPLGFSLSIEHWGTDHSSWTKQHTTSV